MQMFGVAAAADSEDYYLTVDSNTADDVYLLTEEEAQILLECLKNILSGGTCEHTLVHHVSVATPSPEIFKLSFAVTEGYTRGYTVSRRKLANLKIELMSALNG